MAKCLLASWMNTAIATISAEIDNFATQCTCTFTSSQLNIYYGRLKIVNSFNEFPQLYYYSFLNRNTYKELNKFIKEVYQLFLASSVFLICATYLWAQSSLLLLF